MNSQLIVLHHLSFNSFSTYTVFLRLIKSLISVTLIKEENYFSTTYERIGKNTNLNKKFETK